MQIDDSRPIWVQLVAEFRLRIVSGQWAPGSKIPSVRELASSAGVNPNTVQRALAALDRTGLTASSPLTVLSWTQSVPSWPPRPPTPTSPP